MTHPLANKGAALSEIAKRLAVPLAETAVIGDGGNDVAMFERSGLSIAMGNASPQVQQAADFVTDSNREEGFANAVERFILGGGRSSKRAETTRADGTAVVDGTDVAIMPGERVLVAGESGTGKSNARARDRRPMALGRRPDRGAEGGKADAVATAALRHGPLRP